MSNLIQYIVGGAVLVGGLGYGLFSFFHKEKTVFDNLDHVKVPAEWDTLKHEAWSRASRVLTAVGLIAKTKLKEVDITAGIKVNPKTGQWGRPTMMNGKEFWYAGRTFPTSIELVATPEKHPYNKSQAIFTHEVGESILNMNTAWATKSIDERNKFLWGLGL